MDDTPDLDTNAFLESVRELKEKRQREDNERQEQLEAQIASSRLARKLGPSREPSIRNSTACTDRDMQRASEACHHRQCRRQRARTGPHPAAPCLLAPALFRAHPAVGQCQ